VLSTCSILSQRLKKVQRVASSLQRSTLKIKISDIISVRKLQNVDKPFILLMILLQHIVHYSAEV
jgi:hypothetical protein